MLASTRLPLVLSLACLVSTACSKGEGDEGSFTFTTTLTDENGTLDDTGESSTSVATDADADAGGNCGDGVVDQGEECDLGSDNADDGVCTTDCTLAACGDGHVYAGFEECDDGNTSNTDDCVAGCVFASCGDGFVQTNVEPCDDGNDDETDGCTSSCSPSTCGDGIVQAGEQCDDGNMDTSDTCPACQLAFCGDGFVQAGTEECDDGNLLDTDACIAPFCTNAYCGDGLVWEGTEMCDDGNMADNDACPTSCEPAFCGDGFVESGMEQCDDGNNMSDDGCDAMCQSECDGTILVQNWGGWTFYKVPVMGTMTDVNIFAACQACGLQTPCQATAGCSYNDAMCTQTNTENSCGNPMLGLSQQLGCGSPSNCAQLNGVYQYMGNNWVGGCGVENGSWCSQGNSIMNRFAVCVGPA